MTATTSSALNNHNSAPQGDELAKRRAEAQADVRALREKQSTLDQSSLELILTGARSHYAWTDKKVSDDQLREIHDIVKMGSTSMNSNPARFIHVRSPEGKQRLAKSLKPANLPKMMGAPVTTIVAYDTDFWQQLPKLFPHEDRRKLFEGKTAHIERTAFLNSTLQGAYFMIAARAIGLDIGCMSGFSNDIVDEEFFAGTTLKSNFLCNIGYADETALFQRLPRFDFNDTNSFA
jgi:3-hydroxypropanoate dehydrogenase